MVVAKPPEPAAAVPASSSELSHRYRNPAKIVAIVLVIVIVTLVLLYTVPVATSYSYQFSTSPTGEGAMTFNPRSGAQVYGSFYTTTGGPVTFQIQDSIGNYAYENTTQNSSVSGSFSFTAVNPPYTFIAFSLGSSHAPETVAVHGHYTAPVL